MRVSEYKIYILEEWADEALKMLTVYLDHVDWISVKFRNAGGDEDLVAVVQFLVDGEVIEQSALVKQIDRKSVRVAMDKALQALLRSTGDK